jgi:sugar phosphate isomerase/epimerase
MGAKSPTFAVFTKPWKMPAPELGAYLAGLGFTGIELPIRPGYQVEPDNVRRTLPLVTRQLAEQGLTVHSVATTPNEETIAACGEAGIPIIRICVGIFDEGYMWSMDYHRKTFDALIPHLDTHGVTIGIQNHCDRCVSNAMGLLHLAQGYDPKHLAIVWDAAHNALNGEDPELAIEIVWPQLCMVNLKNAFWRRDTGPEAEYAQWSTYWTSGRQGLASWPRVAAELTQRAYSGVLCLTAEYSDEHAADRLIVEDLAFAKSLFLEPACCAGEKGA